MFMTRRALLGATTAVIALPRRRAWGAETSTVRIGIMRGPWVSIGALCVRQAAEEFGAGKDLKVEVLEADHKMKADVALGIARQWFEQDGVDAILDAPATPPALAVSGLCREKNKVFVACTVGTTDLTGKACSPNTVQWAFDFYMMAKSTGTAVVKAGGDTWFIIYADYLGGQQMLTHTTNVVTAAGGKVLGTASHPWMSKADISGPVRQAQASGAKVLGLCNAGDDFTAALKAARAVGAVPAMKVAAIDQQADDTHDDGLELVQGTIVTESFYWDLNDRTRAFTKRIQSKAPNAIPGMSTAGNYAAALHYLKAVDDMGVAAAKADGGAVVARMKAMPTDDDCFGPGSIRLDGRKLHPAYVFQVKSPAESTSEWDLYKLLGTTPADQAFRPMSEGGCPFVHT